MAVVFAGFGAGLAGLGRLVFGLGGVGLLHAVNPSKQIRQRIVNRHHAAAGGAIDSSDRDISGNGIPVFLKSMETMPTIILDNIFGISHFKRHSKERNMKSELHDLLLWLTSYCGWVGLTSKKGFMLVG